VTLCQAQIFNTSALRSSRGFCRNKASNFPPETKTSYQRDIETTGKKDEGELLGGTIIRIGRQAGIPAPNTAALYADIQKRRMAAAAALEI
jgi:ketopantoate reductase